MSHYIVCRNSLVLHYVSYCIVRPSSVGIVMMPPVCFKPVENGARGPENEPFKGAGSHALGAQSFRRPCNVDILAPETMLADPKEWLE